MRQTLVLLSDTRFQTGDDGLIVPRDFASRPAQDRLDFGFGVAIFGEFFFVDLDRRRNDADQCVDGFAHGLHHRADVVKAGTLDFPGSDSADGSERNSRQVRHGLVGHAVFFHQSADLQIEFHIFAS